MKQLSTREIEDIKRVHAMFKTVFPECDFVLITPDRSERYQALVDQLKSAGVKGIWRVKKKC